MRNTAQYTDASSQSLASRIHGRSLPQTSLFQRSLWFLQQLDEQSLWVTSTIDWRVPIDINTLKKCLRWLEIRYPILRSKFNRLPWGEIEQSIDYDTPLTIQPATTEQSLQKTIDFSTEPSTQFFLEHGTGQQDRLVIRLHRIIADEVSGHLLTHALIDIYTRLQRGDPVSAATHLHDGMLTYPEYAQEQRTAILRGDYQAAIHYWQKQLAVQCPALNLPFDFSRMRSRSKLDSHQRCTLPPITLEKLISLASQWKSLSPNQAADPILILRSVYAILLYRYTGQNDIRIGLFNTGRSSHGQEMPGLAKMIGPLENIQISTCALHSTDSCFEIMQKLAAQDHAAAPHANLPFEHLLERLNADGTQKHTMPFEVAFAHRQHPPFDHDPAWIQKIQIETDAILNAAICMEVRSDPNGELQLNIQYASTLFKADTIARLQADFITLLNQVIANPARQLHQLELVTQSALEQLSAPWPDQHYTDTPVHRLIEDQAQQQAERVAVICEDQLLTYKTLDQRANQLAHYLIHTGICTESRVGVALRRSTELIIALLAVFKAGGTLVPIDPTHPEQRIAYVLEDAQVALIITDGILQTPPTIQHPHKLRQLDLTQFDWQAWPKTSAHSAIHPKQLAYMIYTSGSTGAPKAVAVAHGALSLHCQATAALYDMSSESRELHFLSISFDGAHERWIVPLLAGGCVILRPDTIWSAAETHAACARHGVNNAGFPTSYLQQLAAWKAPDARSATTARLRLISFGGEGMPRHSYAQVQQNLAPAWLINGYGPTETVISPLAWKARAQENFDGLFAPIGRAVGARRAYVLDQDLNPVPIGIAGELYIGGACLARGYHNRPGATAERFLPDPFSGDGGRMYKTGDQVRWRTDGVIEFLGRLDTQVKIRGFRIELGEIEAVLRQQPGVQAAAATVHTTAQGKKLIGYVIPDNNTPMNVASLRAALALRLPDYMVPSLLLSLEALPLSPTGKLDRQALPIPATQTKHLIPPSTPLEQQLVKIWQEILHVDPIGITDNFFDLGGDSLSALQIVNAMNTSLPTQNIQLVDIFNYPDIQQLAHAISHAPEIPFSTLTTAHSEVVRLQQSGTRPMLYCFPGLLVSTREYNALIQHLGSNQPATGFICHSLSRINSTHGTATQVETLAQTYADYICTHSAGQPCFLLGWSWGGILAYETARLLQNKVDIKFIGMLDVCALDAEFAIGSEQPLAPDVRTPLQQSVDVWLTQSCMRPQWLELLARMDATVYTQFLHYINNSPESLPLDGPAVGSREHIFWNLMDNALVFRHYQLRPLNCPIHVWIAEDSLLRGMNVIDWHTYSNQVIKVEKIADTTHLEIIRHPRFHTSFAESIAESLHS